MKKCSPRFPNREWCLFLLILILCCLFYVGENANAAGEMRKFNLENAEIQRAISVQHRNTPQIMALPQVVGTAIGVSEEESPTILAFTQEAIRPGLIPRSLQGVPVIVKIIGPIFAIETARSINSKRIDPIARLPRPVPIGVSTGNEGECSAGTIGARVKNGESVYALSNNHVYALENDAPLGSRILQPGLFDTNCTLDPDDVIGSLFAYQPIDFSSTANNVIDAAIALSTHAFLGNATPRGGYGMPKSTTLQAAINQRVQKYGRSSALTMGRVVALNATINVIYSGRTTRFVNQIVVKGKSFIKAGDSGSLLVSYPGKKPVGLLFAGNSTGSYAFANPINDVLDYFGVTIDGK